MDVPALIHVLKLEIVNERVNNNVYKCLKWTSIAGNFGSPLPIGYKALIFLGTTQYIPEGPSL